MFFTQNRLLQISPDKGSAIFFQNLFFFILNVISTSNFDHQMLTIVIKIVEIIHIQCVVVK